MRTTLLFISMWTGATLSAQYQLATVATGLTEPLAVSHAGDERLFILERAGIIKILHGDGQLGQQPFLDITDRVSTNSAEKGLLGLAFDPAYASTGRFYVFYADENAAGTNRVRLSRFLVKIGRAHV